MMADRELLEMAAKAAGIQLNNAAMQTMYMGDDGQWVFWNPLKDDGDALRLAVKLHIDIYTPDRDGRVGVLTPECEEVYEPEGVDACAAVRRAIVRAAAAIGEPMP